MLTEVDRPAEALVELTKVKEAMKDSDDRSGLAGVVNNTARALRELDRCAKHTPQLRRPSHLFEAEQPRGVRIARRSPAGDDLGNLVAVVCLTGASCLANGLPIALRRGEQTRLVVSMERGR